MQENEDRQGIFNILHGVQNGAAITGHGFIVLAAEKLKVGKILSAIEDRQRDAGSERPDAGLPVEKIGYLRAEYTALSGEGNGREEGGWAPKVSPDLMSAARLEVRSDHWGDLSNGEAPIVPMGFLKIFARKNLGDFSDLWVPQITPKYTLKHMEKWGDQL